jgi:hypothetical protein
MRASRGDCAFCGRPVLGIETAAWPVTGWEAERSGGGTNALIGRERVLDGRVAHAACAKGTADRARRGIAAAQEALAI